MIGCYGKPLKMVRCWWLRSTTGLSVLSRVGSKARTNIAETAGSNRVGYILDICAQATADKGNLPEPAPLLGDRQVPPSIQLLFGLTEFRLHAVASGFR